MCDICSEEQAPLVPELLLLELGGGVQLQLAPHPLPLPLWAGLSSDEIIPVAFRTLRAMQRGPWSPIYGLWIMEYAYLCTLTGILKTDSTFVVWLCSRSPRFRLKSLTGFPSRCTAGCTESQKTHQILTTISHLVLPQ